MLLHVENIELHVGISQEINTVAVARNLIHDEHGVGDSRGRSGLIVAAIGIVDGQCGVHGECRIEHSVVAILLKYLAKAQCRVELHTTFERTLLKNEAATILLTTAGRIKSVGFLVVKTATEVAVLRRTIYGKILVYIVKIGRAHV